MDLRTYLRTMSPAEAREFAAKVGTTRGALRNVEYGFRPCATDLAVRIERESGRKVTRQELRADWPDHWPELVPAGMSQQVARAA